VKRQAELAKIEAQAKAENDAKEKARLEAEADARERERLANAKGGLLVKTTPSGAMVLQGDALKFAQTNPDTERCGNKVPKAARFPGGQGFQIPLAEKLGSASGDSVARCPYRKRYLKIGKIFRRAPRR
jgi:hypothetical protein